jgi:hypothetical protein
LTYRSLIRQRDVRGAGVGNWCHPVYSAQSFREVRAPATASSREVSDVTRTDLFDLLRDEAEPWWGRLDEISFLGPTKTNRLHVSVFPPLTAAGEPAEWDDKLASLFNACFT